MGAVGSRPAVGGGASPPDAVTITGGGPFLDPTATNFTWSAPADNGAAITKYQWRWSSTSSSSGFTAALETTPTGDTTSPYTLEDGSMIGVYGTIWVQVRAVNSAGAGAWGASYATTNEGF
jgi:hypothetical protein